MEAIKKLNIVDGGFRKLSELEIDTKYEIVLWKFINTAYGNKITVTLLDEDSNFIVFLPNRFNNLNYSEIEELNSSTHYLIYQGTKENKKGFAHIITIE
jgi:hypothetical protein